MGRPRIDELSTPIEDRIEEAFWELVKESAPERISVVALSKKAHCNRGTFYYYFTDIYDLLDRLIQKNLPSSIPYHAIALINGTENVDMLKRVLEAESEKIKRLGLLLDRSQSLYCAEKLKEASIDVWCKAIGIPRSSMTKSHHLLFEFMSNGILGMMAYCCKHKEPLTVEDMINALPPEVPLAIINKAKAQ